jgi:DNA-binding CsgD family transcriptional regulator
VFTTRSWTDADGDAGFPKEVHGVPVAQHIRTRRDQRGALVALEDGRFAVTGPLVAIGGPLQVQRYCRRRLASEEDAAARAWWQEVIGALRFLVRVRESNREAQLAIDRLTPREREVLQALAEGWSDREIATRLHVGVGTVHSHVTNILSKLEVSSRLQALVFAVRHGVVTIE